LVENQNSIQVSMATLKNVLNLPNSITLNLLKQTVEFSVPNEVATQQWLSAPMTCFERKDCLAAVLESEVLESRKSAIKASYLPTLNLSVSDIRSDGQLFLAEEDQQAMLEFSWALFDSGRRAKKIDAMDERKNASLSQLKAVQQNVQQQVQAAVANYRNLESQRILAQSSVALDTERLRISRQRYDAGLLNIDELLDAEASLERSNSDLVRAVLGEQAAIVGVKRALGQKYSN